MNVAVVGLGLAGLRACRILENAGVRVTAFEARDRVGGRLFTAQSTTGAEYEAGAEWIDAEHTRVLASFSDLGIELLPPETLPDLAEFQGELRDQRALWDEAKTDELYFERKAETLCRDLQQPPWINRHARALDTRVVSDLVQECCRSSRGRWWVTAKYRSDEGDDLDQISLLGWLTGYLLYVGREPGAMCAHRFPIAASDWVRRLREQLSGPVELCQTLRQVNSDAAGVTIELVHAATGKNLQERFDRVILALPPTALGLLPNGTLSPQKEAAIGRCRMSRAIKIVWEFEEPWWLARGFSGSAFLSSDLQQIWYCGRSGAHVLCAYVVGRDALRWADNPNAVAESLDTLAKTFPEAKRSFVGGWLHDWPRETFTYGAFSHLAPGYTLDFMEHVSKPEGRVHFAGEHTSLWTGLAEGALESGERAAREVLDNL